MKFGRRLTVFILSLLAVVMCAIGLVACGDKKKPATGECTVHTYGEWQVVTQASCTEDGVEKHVCTVCGQSETQKIDATGHSWNDGEVKTAATCSSTGERLFKCTASGCSGTKTETIEKDASAHKWNDGVITKAATCSAKGEKTYTCLHDGAHTRKEDVAVDANAHSWDDGEVKTAATCSATGEMLFKCTASGCSGTKTETIEKDTSAHKWNDGVVTKAATCSAKGEKTYTCLHDGTHTRKEDVAVDANAHSWDDGTVTITASCVAKGKIVYTCLYDEEHFNEVETEINPANHTNVISDKAVASTCVNKGKTAGSHCGDCLEVITAQKETAINRNAHSLVIVEDECVAASCMTKGVEVYACEYDGCEYVSTKDLAVLGHDWNGERTCVQERACLRCDAVEPALGHSYDGGHVSIELGCLNDEVTEYNCGRCGDSYTAITDLATGHNVIDGNWTRIADSGRQTDTCRYEYTYEGECENCHNAVEKKETVVQHNIQIITKAAKCNEDGSKTYACKDCGEYEGDVVYFEDATAHNWVEATGKLECEYCHTTKTVIKFDDTAATVSKEDLSADGHTEVQLSNASIALDKTISNAIEGSVEVAADVRNVDELDLTEEQKNRIGGEVYDFSLRVENENFDFNGGKVTVTIPYGLQEGDDPEFIAVWYVYTDENGDTQVESIRATYSEDENGNGFVTFETSHFSVYTVTRLTAEERCALYGHNYNTVREETPTCTQDGYKLQTCLRCGDSKITDYVKANGHQVTEADRKDATCTQDGYIGYECENCNVISYEVVLHAIGHSWEVIENEAATCTSAGFVKYECENCSEQYIQTRAQLNHSYVSTVTAPTCTEAGFTSYVCSGCGNTYKDSYRNETGHSYDSTVVAPDCKTGSDGYTSHVCTVCGDEGENTDIVKAAHTWDIAEATCGKGQTCLICGADGASATGNHDMVNGVCAVCGQGCEHDYEEAVVKVSCTEAGYKQKVCKICGAVEVTDYEAALGHVGVTECERCHTRLLEEEFFVNALVSLMAQDIAFRADGIRFILEFNDMNEQYDVDFAELYLTVDEEGTVTGYGSGVYTTAGSDSPVVVRGEITAVIRDGYMYVKMIMPYYGSPYSVSTQTFTTYHIIPLDGLGGELNDVQGIITTFTNVYGWLNNDLLSLVRNALAVENEDLNRVLNILADKFLDIDAKTGGYVITLNPEAISELADNLEERTVAENVDIIFGEGTYASLKTKIVNLAGSTVGELVDLLEAHGFKLNDVIAVADKLIPMVTSDYDDLDSILGELLDQSDFVLRMYVAKNRNTPVLDVINEFMGIEDEDEKINIDMVKDYIDMVGDSNLYVLIGEIIGFSEDEELVGEFTFKELVSNTVKAVLNELTVSVNTDSMGNVITLVADLGKTVCDKLFEASCSQFTVTTEFAGTADYNGLLKEVKKFVGTIKLDKKTIEALYPEAEITVNADGSITVTETSEGEEFNGQEIVPGDEYPIWREYYIVYSQRYTYTFTENPRLTVTEDCGSWYAVDLTARVTYNRSERFVIRDYVNTELVDETEQSGKVWEYDSVTDISFMYNTATGRYDFENGTKHKFVEDYSLRKDAVGCVDEWGEKHYFCEDCGASYVEYFMNGHNQDRRYELIDEELGCEGGIREVYYCTECEEVLFTYEMLPDWYEGHFTVFKELDGVCPWHDVRYFECVCGEVKRIEYFDRESLSYMYNGDENNSIEVWYCDTCGLREEHETTRKYEVENCREIYTWHDKICVGDEVYFEEENNSESEKHSMKWAAKLMEDSKTCTDGCYGMTVCTICGFEYVIRDNVFYDHFTFESDKEIDLAQYGANCGEKIFYEVCACGQVEHAGVDIAKGDYSNYEYVNGEQKQITINGQTYGYIESFGCVYKCAVTDPQCSFIYADVRVYDAQNCLETRYLYIGCDAEGNNPQLTIVYGENERHDFRDYEFVSTGTPCEYSEYSSCLKCGKALENGSIVTRHEEYLHFDRITDETCTRFSKNHIWCERCGLDQYEYYQPHGHGNWIDGGDGFEYCGYCGMQNSNGSNGFIILEDYTDYGNAEYNEYVVGYYISNFSYENQDYRNFGYSLYITLILSDKTAVAVAVQPYDYYGSEGHYVAFPKSAVESWAAENGYTDYEIRLTFVPDEGDENLEYGITFGSSDGLSALLENIKTKNLDQMESSWNWLQEAMYLVAGYQDRYDSMRESITNATTLKQVSNVYSEFETMKTEIERMGPHEHQASNEKEYKAEGNMHYQICELCGRRFNEDGHQPTWENSFNGWFSDENSHYGLCSLCGEKYEESGHELNERYECDENSHYKFCVICGEKREEGAHDVVATMSGNSEYHEMKCTVCDYCSGNEVHSFNGDGYCTECNYYNGEHEHNYTAATGKCTVCGQTCEHDYSFTSQNEYSHVGTCSKCGYVSEPMGHYWQEPNENGDVICSECDYACRHNSRHAEGDDDCVCYICSKVCAHEFVNCRCVCGMENHSYGEEWNYDEFNHYHVCSQCGMQTDFKGHEYDNGACVECGYKNN